MTEYTANNYEKLFEKLYKQLCAFGYQYLNDYELAQDLVMEIFLKVCENQITFKNERHAKDYLYKAIKNKCYNYLISKQYKLTKRCELINLKEHDTEFYVSENVVIERCNAIEKAIDNLPKKAAKVIRLSVENYRISEIANELSISVNTVKDHKKKAYSRLRNQLSEKVYFTD